jgi:hypothetical protein
MAGCRRLGGVIELPTGAGGVEGEGVWGDWPWRGGKQRKHRGTEHRGAEGRSKVVVIAL